MTDWFYLSEGEAEKIRLYAINGFKLGIYWCWCILSATTPVSGWVIPARSRSACRVFSFWVLRPATQRLSLTVADTAFGLILTIVFPFHLWAYKLHGRQAAAQMGPAPFLSHWEGRIFRTAGNAERCSWNCSNRAAGGCRWDTFGRECFHSRTPLCREQTRDLYDVWVFYKDVDISDIKSQETRKPLTGWDCIEPGILKMPAAYYIRKVTTLNFFLYSAGDCRNVCYKWILLYPGAVSCLPRIMSLTGRRFLLKIIAGKESVQQCVSMEISVL